MDRPPFHRVLVPSDGSTLSASAVALAAHLTRDGGSVMLAHAVALTTCGNVGRDLFENQKQIAAAAGSSATAVSVDGITGERIARAARQYEVDAVVVGSGCTAEGSLRESYVPTIVVRKERPPAERVFGCVLAAVDGSEASLRAAYLAVDLAARDGGSVVFLHVVQATGEDAAVEFALDFARQHAARSDVPYDTAFVRAGAAAEAIRIAAQVCHADAVAVGTHGRRGSGPLVRSRVALSVLRDDALPVVVLPAAVGPFEDPARRPRMSGAAGAPRR